MPLCWRMGRVTKLYQLSDGTCRVEEIYTANGFIKQRDRMCPLPVNQELKEDYNGAEDEHA